MQQLTGEVGKALCTWPVTLVTFHIARSRDSFKVSFLTELWAQIGRRNNGAQFFTVSPPLLWFPTALPAHQPLSFSLSLSCSRYIYSYPTLPLWSIPAILSYLAVYREAGLRRSCKGVSGACATRYQDLLSLSSLISHQIYQICVSNTEDPNGPLLKRRVWIGSCYLPFPSSCKLTLALQYAKHRFLLQCISLSFGCRITWKQTGEGEVFLLLLLDAYFRQQSNKAPA